MVLAAKLERLQMTGFEGRLGRHDGGNAAMQIDDAGCLQKRRPSGKQGATNGKSSNISRGGRLW